jgi:uncharacterized membrane protein
MEIVKHRHNISIALTLVLMLSFFVLSTSPQITGFATYLDSNSYTETLDLDLADSQIVTWTPEQEFLDISSVKISGSISEETLAKVYLVDGDKEYLLFDTVTEEQPTGFQITGNAVADTESFSIPAETGDDLSEANVEDVGDSETVSEETDESKIRGSAESSDSVGTTADAVETQKESEQLEESSEEVDSIVQEETDSETLIEEEQTDEEQQEDTTATEEDSNADETPEEQPETITEPEQSPVTPPSEDGVEPEQEQIEFVTFEDQCVETCDVALASKEFELKVVVSSGEVHIDAITYTIVPEAEDVTEEVNETETNDTVVEELQDRTEETIQLEQVVINQPARWKKIVTLAEPTANVEISVPAEAQNLRLLGKDGFAIKSARLIESDTGAPSEPSFGLADNETTATETQTDTQDNEKTVLIEEEVETVSIEYETPGPTAEETNMVSGKKQMIVSSEIHYEDVLAFMDIPDTSSEAITFYWYEESEVLNEETEEIETVVEKIDVTYDEHIALTYYDSNEDGLVDSVEWNIPHMSNQTFEIEITVLNVQSYPTVGGNWTVMFETVGTANLTISTIDGTTWSESGGDVDLTFLELLCGNQTQEYVWTGESKIFVEDYSCNETGYETSKVLTEGGHYLEFEFGNATARAQNAASDCHVTATETMLADVTCPDGFNVTATGSLETDGYNITITGGNLSIEPGGELNLTESSNITSTVVAHVYGTLNASGTDSDLSFGAIRYYAGGTYEATNATTTLTGNYNGYALYYSNGDFIHNDGTIVIDNDGTSVYLITPVKPINNIEFTDGSRGQLWKNVNITGNLTIDVGESSYVELRATGTVYANNINISSGNLTQQGTETVNLVATGDVVIEDGAYLLAPNNGDYNFGSLTINSGGTYNATSGTTTITTGNLKFSGGSGTFTHNDGTVLFTGSAQKIGDDYNFVLYNLIVQSSGYVRTWNRDLLIENDLNISTGTLQSAYGGQKSITVIGDVVIENGGVLNTTGLEAPDDDHSFGSLTINSGGLYDATSGTTNITGPLTLAETGTLTQNTGAMFVSGDSNISKDVIADGNWTLNGNISCQNMTFSGELLDLNGYRLNSSGEVHLATNTTLVENGTIIAQLFNTTYHNNWTIGADEVLNLSQVNTSYSGSLRINDGGTFHAPYGTANVYSDGPSALGYSLYKQSAGRFIHNEGKVENWCGYIGYSGNADFTGENAFYDLAFSYTDKEDLKYGCWNFIYGSIDVRHDITHQGFGSGYGIWQWNWGVGPYTLTLGNESYGSQANFQHMYGGPTTMMVIQAYNDSHPANLTFNSYNCMLDNVHCNLNAYAPNNVTISGLILNQEINRAEDAAPKTLYVAGPVNFTQGVVLSSSTLIFEEGVNATVEPGTTWSISDTLVADKINNFGTMDIIPGGVVNFLDTSDAGFSGDGTLNVEGSEPFIGNDTGYLPDAYFDCGTGADLLSYENLTYSAWMKSTDSQWSNILYHYTSSGYEGVSLGAHLNASGDYNDARFRVENDSGDAWSIYDETVDMIDGEWHHIAGVLNRSNNIIYLYVDGELKNQIDVTGLGTMSEPTQLRIGHKYSSYGYTGYVDDVRIYDQPLSAEDILALNATTFSDTTDLVAHWTFDEVYNGTASDYVGDNDCTPVGARGIRTTIIGGTTYPWTINGSEITKTFNWSALSYGNNTADEFIYTYNSLDFGNNNGFFFDAPESAADACTFTTSGTLTGDLECSTLTINAGAVVDTNNYSVTASGLATISGVFNATGDIVDHEFEALVVNSGGTYAATNGSTILNGKVEETRDNSLEVYSGATFTSNNGTFTFEQNDGYINYLIAGDGLTFYNYNCSVNRCRIADNVTVENALTADLTLWLTSEDLYLYLGTDTNSATFDANLEIIQDNTHVYAVSETYPAIIQSSNIDRDGAEAGFISYFKWLNYTVDLDTETDFPGTDITLDGNCWFKNVTIGEEDTLNVNGYNATFDGTLRTLRNNATLKSESTNESRIWAENVNLTGHTYNASNMNLVLNGSGTTQMHANFRSVDIHGDYEIEFDHFIGADFAGTAGELNIGNDDSLKITDNLTISFWVLKQSIESNYIITNWYDEDYSIAMDSDDVTFWHGQNEGSGTAENHGCNIQADPVAAGMRNLKWVHVVVVRDTTASQIQMYTNNYACDPDDYVYTPVSTSRDVIIGQNFDEGVKLADMRIYNRTVSADEVQLLYDNPGASVVQADLVSWYRFTNASNLGQDFVGSNHGTQTGTDYEINPIGFTNTTVNISSGSLNTSSYEYRMQFGGNLAVDSAGELDLQGSYASFGQDLNVTGGTLHDENSTIIFLSADPQTLYTSGSEQFYNLKVANADTGTTTLADGELNVTNVLTVYNSTLSANTGENHSLNDVVVYGAGTLVTTADTTFVSGDLNNSGTFTHSLGILNLTGIGTLFGLSGNSRANYLIVDQSAEIVNNDSLEVLSGPEVFGLLNSSTSIQNSTFEILNITSTGTYEATSGTTTIINIAANNYSLIKSGTFIHNNGTIKINVSDELNLSSDLSGQLYSLELDNDEIVNLESNFNLAGDLVVLTGSTLNILFDNSDKDLTVSETFYLNGTYDGRTSNPKFGGFVIQDEGQYKLTNATLTLTGANHELRNDGSSGAEPYPILLDDLSELCTVLNISEGANINMSGAWDSQYTSGSQYGQEVIFVDGTLNILPGAEINFSTIAEWYVGSNPGYCAHVSSNYDHFIGFRGAGNLNVEGSSGNEVVIQDFKGGTSHPDWADWYINASEMNISMNFADVSYGNNTADNVIFVRNGIDSGYNTPIDKWLFEVPAGECRINMTMTLGSNLECSKVIIEDGYELDANGYTITSTNYTRVNGTLYGSTADQHLTFLKVNSAGVYNTTTGVTHLTSGGVVDGNLIFEGGSINGSILINDSQSIWPSASFTGGDVIPNRELSADSESPIFYNLRIPYMSTFNANTATVTVKHNFTNSGGIIGESAVHLNGTEYVYFDAISAMESNVFTFEAWVNPSGAGDRTVISYHDYANMDEINQEGFMVQVQDNNTILFEAPELTPATVESIGMIDNETYTHIAVVHKTDAVEIYLNGELDRSVATSASIQESDQARTAIGANIQFSPIAPTISEPFIGVIDEVKYWTVALEEHEIRANMFKEVSSDDANYASLIMYAKLDDYGSSTFNLEKDGTLATIKDYNGTASGGDDLATTTGWVGVGNWSYDTSTMNFTEEGVISYVDNLTFYNLAAGYTAGETALFNSTTAMDSIYVLNNFETDIGVAQFENMNVSANIAAGTGSIIGDNLQANGSVSDSGATFQSVDNFTYTNESNAIGSSTYSNLILYGHNGLFGDVVAVTDVHIMDNQSLFTNFYDLNTSKILIGNYSELNISESSAVRFSSTSGFAGSNGTINAIGKAQQKLSGAYFDGTDDHINVTHNDDLDVLTHNMSFSVWVNTNDTGTVALLSKGRPAGSKEKGYALSLTHEPEQYAFFNIYDESNLRGFYVDVGDDLNDSLWHNVVFVLNSTESWTYVHVYVDSVYKGTQSFTPINSVDNTADLQLGMYRDETDKYLSGVLDDVRIFNRSLLDSEIISIYNLDDVSEGLVAQYEFENAHAWDGSTAEVWDSTGNEHNGTTYGAKTSQAIISATDLGEDYWTFTADTKLNASFAKFEGYSSAGMNNYSLFGVWLNNISGTAWSLDINETTNVSNSVDNFQRIKVSDANIGLYISDNVSTLIDITIEDDMQIYNIDTASIEGGSIEFINSSFNITTTENNFETDIISLNHNDLLNNYYIQVWSGHVLSLSSLTNKYNLADNVYVSDNTFHSDQNATIHSLELEADNDVTFHIKDETVLEILNGSFTYVDGDLSIEDGSYLNKDWYLDIYVNDSEGVAGYTNITVNDTNGNHIFNGTTDVDGYIQTNLTEYRISDSTKDFTYYSNYSILAESNYSVDLYMSASVNMSDNQVISIDLQDYQAPQISIISPLNATYVKKTVNSILLKADINDTVKIESINYTLINSTSEDILNSSVDLSSSSITDRYLEINWENEDWTGLDGNYTLNITAYDNFGNANSNITDFYVDNTDPVISSEGSSVSPTSLPVNYNLSINANVTDENILAVWANVTSNGESEYINLTQQEDITVFNISHRVKAIGSYDTVELYAEDRAGNLDGPTSLSTLNTYLLAHTPESFDSTAVETATFELGEFVQINVNVTDPLNFTDIDVCLVNLTNTDYIHTSEVNMTLDEANLDTGISIYNYNITAIPYNVTSIGDWQIDVFCNISDSYTSINSTNITAVYTSYPGFSVAGANLADFGTDVDTEIYANITGIINETDSSVLVNVSWPNGNISEYNMTLAEYGASANLWNVTFNGSNVESDDYDVTGEYNATIYVTDYNGNPNATNITFNVYDTTTINLTLLPENLTVTTVNASSGYEYNLTAIFYNTGNATALSVGIDALEASVPAGWTFESEDGSICDSERGDEQVRIGENCTKIYTVSIPANEVSGEHDFTFFASYNDLTGAPSNPTSMAYVTISANPILSLNETEINGTVHHNVNRELLDNLLLTSAGNAILENITFLNTSGTLNNSWINFSYSEDRNETPILELASNTTTDVYINASVPAGYPAGNYTGTYVVNASNTTCLSGYDDRCYDSFDLNIEVPENSSWYSPSEINTTVYDNTSGNLTEFNITNIGNINMTWIITDLEGNASSLVTMYNTSMTVDKEFLGTGNNTHTIHGNYTIPLTQQPGVYEYILQITNTTLNPGEINTTLNIIVVDNIDPTLVSTALSTEDTDNRTDFNQSMQIEGSATDNIGVSEMWAFIQTPNGTNDTQYLTDSPTWVPALLSGEFNSTENNGSLKLIENEYLDTSDPRIIWHLNESSGENTEDSSDNDNLATVNGAVYASGKYDNALSFDGTDDYLNSSNIALSTDNRTFALWVKLNDKTQDISIISKYLDFEINQTSSLSWKATIYDSAGTGTSVSDPTSYEEDVWHHITLILDDDQNIKLYIDGTLRASDTYTSLYGVSTPIEVGRGWNGGGYFNGYVDEVLIFERALNASEVYQLAGDYTPNGNYTSPFYNASSVTFWSNAYWSGDVPEGTNITIQFQTSEDNITWSAWSSEYSDSGSDLTSIGNSSVIKAKFNLYTNDTHYTPTIDIFNVTYGANYIFRGNYTPLQDGIHNVTVYVNDTSNNTVTAYAGYFQTVANTTADITAVLNDTTYEIDSYGNLTVTANNTGNASMYYAELRAYADSGINVYGNDTYVCGEIVPEANCSHDFEIYFSSQLIESATYSVYGDVNWTNPSGSLGSETAADSFEATVPTDARLRAIPEELADTVDHGYSGLLNEFNLSVTGGTGTYISDIQFNVADVDSGWVSLSEESPFTLTAGTNRTIYLTLDIPAGTAAGNYSANITSYGNPFNCDDSEHCNTTLIYNITVSEENNNWNVSPLGVDISEAAAGSQTYYPLNITNDGNSLLQLKLTNDGHTLTCFDPYDQAGYCDGADCVCDYLLSVVATNDSEAPSLRYLNLTAQNSTEIYLKYQTEYVGEHIFNLNFENLVNTTIQTIPVNITSLGPPPNIDNITADPQIQDINGSLNPDPFVNLTANITQDGSFGVTNASMNLTTPAGENIELDFITPGGIYNEGIWIANYTEINTAGTYTVTVQATNDNGALSTNTTTFLIVANTTVNLTANPEETTLSAISQNTSETFEVNLTVNNTGNGTSSNTINIYPPTGFSASPSAVSAFTLNRSQSDVKYVNITAAAGTRSGYYDINYTNTWANPDGTTNEINSTTTVTVSSIRQLDIDESSLSIYLYPDETEQHNFTISSTGTANLLTIDLACEGDCSYFNYTFDPDQIASLVVGDSEIISVNITPKVDTLASTYNLNFTADSFGEASDYIPVIVVVEEHKNWTISPTSISRSVGNDTYGIFGGITIANTGDVSGTYNISLLNDTEEFFNVSEDYEQVSIQPGSSSLIPVNYSANATGTYTAIFSVDTDATLAQQNVSLTATVVPLIVDIIVPTQANETLVAPEDTVLVWANISNAGVALTTDLDWSVEIASSSATINSNAYDATSELWKINCTVPDLSPGAVDIEVTGTYSEVSVSDIELYAINVTDIAPPTIGNVTWPYTTSSGNVTLDADISDDSDINNVWAEVVLVNGSLENYTMNNVSASNWTVNITNITDSGDYDTIIFANDSWGNIGNATTWFEVRNETTYTFSGVITDVKAVVWNTTFDFRKPGTEYVLYNLSSDSETGAYSEQVHRRTYDLYMTTGNNSILLENISVTNDLENTITLYGFDTGDMTLNDVGYGPYSEIYFESSLVTDNEELTMRYDEPIAAKNLLGIYTCNAWNYDNARPLCDNYNYTRYSNTTVNLTSWVIYADVGNLSGPYLMSHFICGDQVCDEDYGESPYTCSRDCGGVTSSSESDQLSAIAAAAASSGGGGGGGGGADIDEIEDLLGTAQQEIDTDTDVLQVVLTPGETRVVKVGIRNNKFYDDSVELSIDSSNIFPFMDILDDDLDIGAKDINYTDIKFSTSLTTMIGTYSGNLVIDSEDSSARQVPVVLHVVDPDMPLLDVVVTPLTKRVAPGDQLMYKVEILNMGETERVDIVNSHIIREIETGAVILKLSETIAVDERLTYTKAFNISESTREGQYQIELVAKYADGERTAMALETFEVTSEPLVFSAVKRLSKSWITYVLIVLFVLLVYYGPILYNLWKARRKQQQRYVFPLDKKFLPTKSDNSVSVGRVAETQDNAYVNLLDLKVHMLCAGATGGGKSVSAQIVVEEALRKGVAVIVFDPTFQWSGFINKSTDASMMKLYEKFGMKQEEASAFNTKLFQVEDPDMKIDITKYIVPGQITVFGMNKLTASKLDTFVKNTIKAVFDANLPTTSKLKLLLVYDEIHRVLPKYGGSKAYLYLEKGVREFRKWGVGMVMISQVISDFKEAIATNIGTEIQMRTKYKGDLKRVEDKYGKEYSVALPRLKVGTGMVQNSEYNKGRPYFVEFRPLLHSTDKVTDSQYAEMKKLEGVLFQIGTKLVAFKKAGKKIDDVKVEFDLARDKLKSGNTRMVKSYIESIIGKLKKMQ